MNDGDEQDPIHNQDQPGQPAPTADSANAAPLSAAPSEDLFAEPPTFVLPAIPIAPPRAMDASVSRALASGDDLLDIVRSPLAQAPPKPVLRDPIPDDLDPALFLKPPPSNPNPPVPPSLSSVTLADHLTHALRPESPTADEVSTTDDLSVAAFPITPIKPFAAPPHAEPLQDDAASTDPAGAPSFPRPFAESVGIEEPQTTIAPPEFRLEPEPVTRIPNFGHLFILGVIALFGLAAAGISVQIAFHFHLWGITTIEKATTDIHYTLASMAVLYVVSFAVAFFLFPFLWHKPFFAGLQWNAPAAVRYRNWLFAAAIFCFILAILDEFAIPGPTNAPIDKMFSNTAAAWLLFAFGVTVAPFFEEMTFRGFLLPALCTAVDWAVSKRNGRPQLPLGPNGHPQWSLARHDCWIAAHQPSLRRHACGPDRPLHRPACAALLRQPCALFCPPGHTLSRRQHPRPRLV